MAGQALRRDQITHPRGSVPRSIGTLAVSFRWAMEMRRRCENERARGRQLDGDTLRRIARDVDDWLGRR